MQECKLYVYGDIGEDYNQIDCSWLARQVHEAKEYGCEYFEIRVNSAGGDLMNAYSLYAAIMEARSEGCMVETYNDGIAGSAASAIFLSGSVRKMAEHATIMIHQATGGTNKEAIEKVNAGLMQAYMTTTGASEETVMGWMSKDTWFTAQEALQMGLATEIYKPGEVEIAENYIALGTQFYAKANKTPLFEAQTTEDMTDNEKALQAEKEQLEALNAELQAKVQAFEDEKAEALSSMAEALVNEGIEVGFVEAEKKEEELVTAKANTAFYASILERFKAASAKAKPMPIPSLNPKPKEDNTSFEAKTYKELDRKHPKVLAEIKANDPARFISLYKAEFGVEPVI
jgi:ATP-dependent protease ClpP protease subunit